MLETPQKHNSTRLYITTISGLTFVNSWRCVKNKSVIMRMARGQSAGKTNIN